MIENRGRIYCQWFALCDNEATTTRPHPTLGDVPICESCDDKVNGLSEQIKNKPPKQVRKIGGRLR